MTSRLLIGLPSTLIYDCYLSWSKLEKLVAPDQNFLPTPIDAAKHHTVHTGPFAACLLLTSVAWLDMCACFLPLPFKQC